MVPTSRLSLKPGESTSSIKFNAANTKWALGAADTELLSNGVTKIKPRRNLSQTDFADLWWVGDRADGGYVAVHLKNSLSTDGFSLQTSKNGKGQTSVTLTGHVSINAQNEMPMEFYSSAPSEG